MVRPLAVLAAVATAAAAMTLPAAHASSQLVTGTVAPMLGVGADGSVGGTVRATVTREMRGDVLYVTVVPAG